MQIEFLRSWQRYKPGDRVDWPDGQANEVVRRNLARRVEQESQSSASTSAARPRRNR